MAARANEKDCQPGEEGLNTKAKEHPVIWLQGVKAKKMAKILVVDDDPDMVEVMKVALESASHKVVVAYNGQQGVDKARSQKPDAIILDIMMPVKDGFVTCKELKDDPSCRDIPILVLTGVSEHFAHSRYAKSMGLDLDAEDYIDKPVDPKTLLARLDRLLK
jgi:two-component system alkaline phosphatase synthesis response regulator PhoP